MLFAAGAAEQADGAGEKTVLEFWTWRPEDVEFYANQIALFEAANPEILSIVVDEKKHIPQKLTITIPA
jgi:ABC-type glycerol-3-phosphate transport system substrate-binding protein